MKWVALSGLVGLGPLAAIGPVDLGPGPAERSSAALEELIVRVDLVQSLVQGKLVLQLHADAAKVGSQILQAQQGMCNCRETPISAHSLHLHVYRPQQCCGLEEFCLLPVKLQVW